METPTRRAILRTVGIGCGVGLLLFVSCGAYIFSKMPESQGARLEVQKQVIGVLSGNAYAWIVRTQTGVVLVDSGVDEEAVSAELERQKIPLNRIQAVLLTHTHVDHAGGLAALPKEVEVWMGPGELAVLRGEAPNGGLFQRILSLFMPPPHLKLRFREAKDGQMLSIDGEHFRVIHVPGHTQGGAMFLWKGVLFSGDGLASFGPRLGILPDLMQEDSSVLRRSLERLRRLEFSVLAAGHGGLTKNAKAEVLGILSP